MRESSKKVIIILILKILYCYTSKEYTVTQTDSVTYLLDIGIPCSRKTVGRNLAYLMEAGLPIRRKNGNRGGYYYDFDNDRFFTRFEFKIKTGERE